MAIENQIEKVREQLRRGEFTSEAAVAQGILLPTLHELGWPVFDTSIVIPEYSIEGRRVDYALCHPASRPAIFVEVKKVGHSDGADRQLFEYAFHLGVPMAILTDGQEWSFYLPGEQGRYDERRVYKLDLIERDVEEAVARLEKYLNYNKVCNGDALQAARADYLNIARTREIDAVLPKAWKALIDAPDPLLLDLLAEKAEDLCGYKPDLDKCSIFFRNFETNTAISQSPSMPTKSSIREASSETHQRLPRINKVENFSFDFQGEKYYNRSAREVLVKVFQLLARADAGFLERFASRKHGKKRRYIARDKMELYPGRPDLAEEHSVEFVSGWWLGTNYSRGNIQQILDLALEVVQPQIKSTLKVKVI